ncbi:T6SS effector amidase Tae4 family protein [Limnobacter sp.]|uniref:T6SS effector amidase Tae4 family protein n=1 Tax=Limnobacter sp. TaxID=2003368 RepID=UPI002FE01ED7
MVTFKKLWESHPQVTGNDNPCSANGKPNFPDQCAIRVGAALAACGVKTGSLPGVRHCWHHEKSSGHTLAAEELASGLSKLPIPGVKKAIKVEPSDFKSALNGKKGIIFFKDYWQRTVNGKKESFRNRSGDHIDLWNGFRLVHPRSIVQMYLRIGSFGLGSDHSQSKEIWFWEVL